mmetsp:Transcript_94156/g.202086  ORF Transcript_94156/g.202086 Transcript_94156/m.202086 type:complete len:270 (+) Transcript_94156:164-973(+)
MCARPVLSRTTTFGPGSGALRTTSPLSASCNPNTPKGQTAIRARIPQLALAPPPLLPSVAPSSSGSPLAGVSVGGSSAGGSFASTGLADGGSSLAPGPSARVWSKVAEGDVGDVGDMGSSSSCSSSPSAAGGATSAMAAATSVWPQSIAYERGVLRNLSFFFASSALNSSCCRIKLQVSKSPQWATKCNAVRPSLSRAAILVNLLDSRRILQASRFQDAAEVCRAVCPALSFASASVNSSFDSSSSMTVSSHWRAALCKAVAPVFLRVL